MTLNLIGIGLNEKSITYEAKQEIQTADKVYLENYTVDFPYKVDDLKKFLEIELEELDREKVENESILKDAKTKKIVLLVYGDPFSATTHHQLIISCKKQKIPFKVYHNASIITAIAETGLSIYKFGKISSMPSWTKNYKPCSFMNYIKENQEVKAHSLLLIDIGLDFQEALKQLEISSNENNLELKEIIVCSQVGTENQQIILKNIKDLKKIKDVKKPFCFVIPSEMHFIEQEFLESNQNE